MKTRALAKYTKLLSWSKSRPAFITFLGLTMAAGTITGLATTKPVEANSTKEDANTSLLVSRLNILQTQLTSLEEASKKPMREIDLTAIIEKINQLSARLETVKSIDPDELNQRLGESLTHTESALSQQLTSIQSSVNHLEAKQVPTTYLKPEALPFKVVSIDSIQQVAVASVAWDFKTVPLERGDTLAGWKVVRVDYSKQHLELENSKKERVLITDAHIG